MNRRGWASSLVATRYWWGRAVRRGQTALCHQPDGHASTLTASMGSSWPMKPTVTKRPSSQRTNKEDPLPSIRGFRLRDHLWPFVAKNPHSTRIKCVLRLHPSVHTLFHNPLIASGVRIIPLGPFICQLPFCQLRISWTVHPLLAHRRSLLCLCWYLPRVKSLSSTEVELVRVLMNV